MRMFFTGLTDLFLILYLTTITSPQPPSVLTVDDFYKLQSMHQQLQTEKQKTEQDLQEQLRVASQNEKKLADQLAAEQAQVREAVESLHARDVELEQIDRNLDLKDSVLQEKDQQILGLGQAMQAKEALWQEKESSYKAELKTHQEQMQKLLTQAQEFRQLAEQMRESAFEARQKAEEARANQQSALALKEQALKEKAEALKTAEEANQVREKAQAQAGELADALEAMRQDSDKAYQKKVRPLLQKLSVSYETLVSDKRVVYNKELSLLPVRIDGKVFVFFPSQHIGFSRRYDTAPMKLNILYQGKKVERGWFNKDLDLIAVALSGYEGQTAELFPSDAGMDQYMPVLLAVRNNADRNIGNLFRGLSSDYFVVNRDNIRQDEHGVLLHYLKGFRGTGKRAERILLGDQLVDLNARFIGIAKDADQIIRIETLKGWQKKAF